MSILGSRIKELRKKQNLSAEELAAKVGVSPATIYRYESSDIQNMGSDKLWPIAVALNTTPDYLLGRIDDYRTSALGGQTHTRIPVVGHVIAGVPTNAVEDVVDWEDIPKDMAKRGDYIGLRVKGSSMEPRICEGDTVIVRRQETVESGELAVIFVNGDEATLKKVKIVDDGIILIAFNPAVYEPHYYSQREIEELPVSIYGKVVELRGKF